MHEYQHTRVSSSTPLQRVLDALERAGSVPRLASGKWESRCPNHDDRHPSLAIGEGRDGRALLKCRTGCPTPDVLRMIGLTWRDLFDTGPGRR